MSAQPALHTAPDPGRHSDPVFTMHRGGKISIRLVGTDAAAGYVIPGQFGERVAPAVAALVAALARADGMARR